ncbi:Hypothetical predicted protein [Mytilus galloprovincialis]|uniref:Uncharacterized protein n=1 Tax=Mytilus galloprovincialis TaxID=29158 RepID=A0A8B6GGT5_MYTGA|nr:Hypothetical predicted protein [Mytilus galloprovincialis]
MSTLNLQATSNGENIGTSVQGQLSKELIVCFILSVFVMVFGIGFCFVSFKYIALTKQRKATSSIIQSQTSAIPQNSQNIEMENRLYDIINETDMLDVQQVQQMEMSSAYLDVIDDSSIRDGSENKPFENHDNSCELISSAQTHTQENKGDFLSLRSDDSTSSCDEYHQDSTQDYLNPYQSMVQSEMSPPEVTDGVVQDVCCADHEANAKGCTPCSKGYTSTIGQPCRPCLNNSYGERCGGDCSCSVFQICDHVKGCVKIPTTTSVHTTSDDRTYPWRKRTPTHSEHDSFSHTTVNFSDEATFPQVFDASTNGESSNIFQGLLSREIIVYLTLSVLVLIFGMCLCFLFYKYKTVNKKKKATITQSQNPSPTPNSHGIEMEERLYDVIDDADLIEEQKLKDNQMSPDYLDVISGSNSTGSGDGKTEENHENIFESLSTDQIKMLVNKVICSSLNNRESTSSSGEEHQETKQEYLNPYQSVIKTSPTNIREYLTLATVHNRTDNCMVDNKSDVLIKDENILQSPRDLEEIGLRRPYEYENSLISVEYAVPQRCLSRIRGRETKSCENLNSNRLKIKTSLGKDDKNVTSNVNSLEYYNLIRTRSESDIFCKQSSKE